MSLQDIGEELMLIIKSNYFFWMVLTFIFNIISFPLWLLGIFYYDILALQNPITWILSHIIYLIIIFNLSSLYHILGDYKMDNRFYFICCAIVFGMFVWHITFIQGAY